MARSALMVILALAVPVIAVATALAGPGGALGASIGAAVVAGMFLMSGALLSWSARIGPEAMFAAALGGYLLRLMIYALLIVLLRPVEAISGTSLALSAAVLMIAALAWEVRVVSRDPRALWLSPPGPPRGGTARGVVETPHPVETRPDPALSQYTERTRP